MGTSSSSNLSKIPLLTNGRALAVPSKVYAASISDLTRCSSTVLNVHKHQKWTPSNRNNKTMFSSSSKINTAHSLINLTATRQTQPSQKNIMRHSSQLHLHEKNSAEESSSKNIISISS